MTSFEPRRQAWYAPLTASVRALGAAAEEYEVALRAAELAAAHVDPVRREAHPGAVGRLRVGVPGEIVRGHAPHVTAVDELADVYRQQAAMMRVRFEEAALLYAAGCAWAINALAAGSQPQHVVFTSTADGQCVPGPLEIAGLSGWPGLGELEQARRALVAAMDQQAVDELGAATYRYGRHAEAGLHHLLAATPRETPTHHALAAVALDEEAHSHVAS